MPLRNKRHALARVLEGTGALSALERVARKPGLVVLTYHRIGDPAESPLYDYVFSASPESFAQQMRMLRRHYRIMRLEELMAAADEGFAFRQPTALVTFDDGYRDNYERALPILAELGVPATFFLPTGFLDAPRLPWWDHVAHVVKCTRLPRFSLEQPEPIAVEIRRDGTTNAMAAIIRPLLAAGQFDEPSFFAHLHERAELADETAALAGTLFMSWDEARALATLEEMSVGSHSHSHPRLARLSENAQRSELVHSKQRLESELGREIHTLAYPYGDVTAFGSTTQQLAAEAGYRLAFSALPGANRPGAADRYAIQRVNIGQADSLSLVRARLALHASFGKSRL